MLDIGIIEHVEGEKREPSEAIYQQVIDLAMLADSLGVRYAWFSEHHNHAHEGHLPAPLMMALHVAGKTQRIQLGTAVICLNLHHWRDVAEQIAVADALTDGRIEAGFGSGSTPQEFALFGIPDPGESRHAGFADCLERICAGWNNDDTFLPTPSPNLLSRCWIASNSVAAASIAGRFNFNMLFSHLRSIDEYRSLTDAYRAAGGSGRIAANRPVYVGEDDSSAHANAEPALRTLWRRFRREGKIQADAIEPSSVEGLCGHPINFIVGGPESVCRQIKELQRAADFDVLNLEIRWAGLRHNQIHQSLQRFMEQVAPHL